MSKPVPYRVNLIASFLVVIFIHHLNHVSADFTSVKLTKDSEPYVHVKDFCFTESGHFSISVKSFSVTGTTSPANSSRYGFLISPWYIDNDALFYRKEDGVERCFVYKQQRFLSLANPNRSVSIEQDGKYIIYFWNCDPSETFVDLDVEIETYNLDKDGKKDYMSDGETNLPNLFFTFCLIYVIFICFWVYHCCRNLPFLRRIHIWMTALLVVKCVTLFICGEEKYHIKVTGRPDEWKIYLYIFHTIRTVLFWTVTMLIGSGWSYLKPLLELREKIMLAIGFLTQVVVNICYIYVDEVGKFTEAYTYWFCALTVTDLASFAVAAVPFFWFLESLKEVAEEDGKAAKTEQRMRLIASILLAVILYGYLTRGYWFLLGGDRRVYNPETILAGYSEIANIILFVVIYYLLRPVEHNEYVVIEDEESDPIAIERDFDCL